MQYEALIANFTVKTNTFSLKEQLQVALLMKSKRQSIS